MQEFFHFFVIFHFNLEQEGTDIERVADTVWVIFVRLASVQYISYVSLQSFMSSELSVKEFSFIYYLLFSHNSCDHFASTPFRRFQFKRPNAPDSPDGSPSTNIVCISASLQLKEEGDLHREERGGMMMGLYIGGRGGVVGIFLLFCYFSF